MNQEKSVDRIYIYFETFVLGATAVAGMGGDMIAQETYSLAQHFPLISTK